jgi:hypothetical protein
VALTVFMLCCNALNNDTTAAMAGVGYEDACTSLGTALCTEAPGSEPIGVAVDNSTLATAGDVYVVDYGSHQVVRYNAKGEQNLTIPVTGEPALPSEPVYDAVDPNTGDLYLSFLTNPGSVEKFNTKGELEKSFGTEGQITGLAEPAGVAVNPTNGNLLVAVRGTGEINEYNSSGTPIVGGSFADGLPGAANTIAVDSDGNIYADAESIEVLKYPAGERNKPVVLNSNAPNAVAVDPSTGDVYLSEEKGFGVEVAVYEENGTYLRSFGSGDLNPGPVYGVGVNATTHEVYASKISGGSATIFEAFSVPTVTTGAVSELEHTSAKVEGTIKREGVTVSGCFFEYGTEHKACNLTPAAINAGAPTVTVSAKLEGLTPGAKYPYKLVVEAEGHSTSGELLEFETVPLATITTEASTSVTPESATLNGKITPEVNGKVEYYFEYGKTLPEKATTVAEFTGVTGVEKIVAVPLVGLEAETEYHVRLIATVEGHVLNSTGPEVIVKTPPFVTATTEAATAVTAETATLNGTIHVNAGNAHYYFEYHKEGQSAPYPKTEEKTAGVGGAAVAANVTGLESHTLYHFQLVIVSEGRAATPGEELGFATMVAKPLVTGSSVLGTPTRTTVSLSGEINPKNSKTYYDIEYGETEAGGALGSPTPLASLEASTEPQKIAPQTLEELHPGTTYHYRIVATNEGGTTPGPEGTFTTAAPQPPIVEAESSVQVTQTTATINATVNPNGLQTNYILEMGTVVEGKLLYNAISFGQMNGETKAEELTFGLTSLLPGTTYHYRIVAINQDGVVLDSLVPGGELTFTTSSFANQIVEPPHPLIIPVPVEPKPPTPETRAQKLAKALKACAAKPKKKRATCDRQAEKKYGPKVKKKTNKKK